LQISFHLSSEPRANLTCCSAVDQTKI
jgi:hypothetical protein